MMASLSRDARLFHQYVTTPAYGGWPLRDGTWNGVSSIRSPAARSAGPASGP